MSNYFDICGTRISLSDIKDFRIIDVEFIFRPVFGEARRSVVQFSSGKKFEFISMQPYAAIIGQQGQKSALGEYQAKTFKEALGKDLSGAIIYTVADKLKLKAFKQQKYQCVNLAGRAFSTYLDDVPIMLTWNDGRMAEVYKEDPLHKTLGEITTPGIQYVQTLIIKADKVYFFYGNGIQLNNISDEYERLKLATDEYNFNKQLKNGEKFALPKLPKVKLPSPKGSDKIDGKKD